MLSTPCVILVLLSIVDTPSQNGVPHLGLVCIETMLPMFIAITQLRVIVRPLEGLFKWLLLQCLCNFYCWLYLEAFSTRASTHHKTLIVEDWLCKIETIFYGMACWEEEGVFHLLCYMVENLRTIQHKTQFMDIANYSWVGMSLWKHFAIGLF